MLSVSIHSPLHKNIKVKRRSKNITHFSAKSLLLRRPICRNPTRLQIICPRSEFTTQKSTINEKRKTFYDRPCVSSRISYVVPQKRKKLLQTSSASSFYRDSYQYLHHILTELTYLEKSPSHDAFDSLMPQNPYGKQECRNHRTQTS